MSVRAQLPGALGVVILAMFAVAMLEWSHSERIAAASKTRSGAMQTERAIHESAQMLRTLRARTLEHLATDDSTRRDRLDHELLVLDGAFLRQMNVVETAASDASLVSEIDALRIDFGRYVYQRESVVIPASHGGDRSAALAAIVQDTRPMIEGMLEKLDDLRRVQEAIVGAAADEVERSTAAVRRIAFFGAAASVTFGLAGALVLSATKRRRPGSGSAPHGLPPMHADL